jgi:phosphatidate cytidylyltransferase
MSNLMKRSLSSIVFVALILGPLFFSGQMAYLVYGALGLLTLNEVLNLVAYNQTKPIKWISFLIYGCLFLILYLVGYGNFSYTSLIVTVLGLLALLSFIVEVFRQNPAPFQSISAGILAAVFAAASFLGLIYYLGYRTDLPQPWIIVALFALIWINDSAAYLFGRKMGKTKLYERLSPNKTIEGSAAGLICSMLAAAGLSFIHGMPELPIMLGFGAVCVITGSLGDLFESRMKRAAGVKDSGKFLPGHGGFFDRFDAMMLAVPSSILFFEIVLPKP